MSMGRPVAVVGGVRTPFARAFGAYEEATSKDLLTAVLQGLVAKYGLRGERLGDVGGGATLKHSRDWNLTRECVLSSGLDPETPAFEWQRACGSSLDVAGVLAGRIARGEIESGVAAGVDSISDAPLVSSDALRTAIRRTRMARDWASRVGPWLQLRLRDLAPVAPQVREPRTGLSMGESTEVMARKWRIPRAAMDALALTSHQRLEAAYQSGFHDGLVLPYGGLAKDDNLRVDSTLEKLARLRPAFSRDPDGLLTAGNSTPLTDGAAAVLLSSEEWARARGLPVLAYITRHEVAAVDFVNRDGLLFAPTLAVPRMLRKAGLSLGDVDLLEIHEAFAAQVLVTLKAWESEDFGRERLGLEGAFGVVDRDRLNVMGGSLAIGHPFAATGARLVAALAKMLDRERARRGVISVCTAGGMGVATLLER